MQHRNVAEAGVPVRSPAVRRLGSLLIAVVVATLALLLVTSMAPPATRDASPLAEQLAVSEAQAAPGKCEVYAKFESNNFGTLYLRWGDRTFGYRHITAKRVYRPVRINYTLNYGRVVEVNGTTQVVQVRYPNDTEDYRVVFNTTRNSNACPGKQLGIITAYFVDR